MAIRDPLLSRLEVLAAVAVRHAIEFHGETLAYKEASLAAVERILKVEAGNAGNLQTLSTCYGAWFGELLVQTLGGHWIALQEAFAPRVCLGLAAVAPMDAVRRRMLSSDPMTLSERFAQARQWSTPAPARTAVLQRNALGWDHLAEDPRFIADQVPPDRAAAEEMIDPWLKTEGVAGKRILCLAAGGGRHGPLFARAGAEVTVLDLSPAQLAIDTRLAQAHGLRVTTVLGSSDDLVTLLPAAAFDVVVQPVSASYLPDLAPLHAGLAHVLRPGGLLVAQHKQPAALQARAAADAAGWVMESRHLEGLSLPPVSGHGHRESGTQEFLHTLDALIGGLCRAGFVIEDLTEPALGDAWAPAGSAEQRAAVLPPYLKIKARRR